MALPGLKALRRALLAVTAVVALGVAQAGASPLTIVSSVGGAPTGAFRYNFDALTLGTGSPQIAVEVLGGPSMTVNLTPNAAVVQGSASGLYAAPFLSGTNGGGFGPGGSNQANGQDATPYLTTGSTGVFANAAVELVLPFTAQYFGLLWGSVDNYNTLSFYSGASLIGSITGSDVTPAATGDQGLNGTFYVNINSTLGFDRVVATSSQFAFEFDNVALSQNPIIIVDVPEPATLALFGAGLFGLGLARRARRRAA